MGNMEVAGLIGVMLAVATTDVAAQVTGSTTLGASTEKIKALAQGWSAKKQLLDKPLYPVYNEGNERVGEVNDINIAPDKSSAYAIIGEGGPRHR